MLWTPFGALWPKQKTGSDERKALEKVLEAYGAEGERNGMLIAFGPLPGGAYGNVDSTNPFVRVATFDFESFGKSVQAWQSAGQNVDYGVESAGIIAHEGAHAWDKRYSGAPFIDYPGSLATERNAFNAQSIVNMSFNKLSMYGLLNPSWKLVDRERNRENAIEKNAQRARQFGLSIAR